MSSTVPGHRAQGPAHPRCLSSRRGFSSRRFACCLSFMAHDYMCRRKILCAIAIELSPTLRPRDSATSEHLGRPSSGADGHRAGRHELRLHRAPESVPLQGPSRDRLMSEPKLSKRELVAKQSIGIRPVGVTRTDVVDRASDDVHVVVGQSPRRPDRHEPGRLGEPRLQSFGLHDLDVHCAKDDSGEDTQI